MCDDCSGFVASFPGKGFFSLTFGKFWPCLILCVACIYSDRDHVSVRCPQPFDNGPNGVCTLAIPTFIGGSGAAIMCRDESPCLHVSLNAANTPEKTGKPFKWGVGVANFDRMILPRPSSEAAGDGVLCLQSRARYDWPHVRHPWLVDDDKGNATSDTQSQRKEPLLRFTVGAARDARDAAEQFVYASLLAANPSGRVAPPVGMLRHPIWTTWAKYKDGVTQNDVLAFAEEIVDRNLPRSVMEIDDRWSVKYGDLEFDRSKFPDPAGMVARLHELGFLVTLWIIPFANLDSRAVTSTETRKFFVTNSSGDVGEFDWWQPTRVAALDVTNPEACEWFLSRLKRLQSEYGLDGFKFDAGEPSFLPPNCVTARPLGTPSDYTRLWVGKVAGQFEVSEVRAGVSGTEHCAPLLRLFDRFSTWGVENGLASVISSLLTASVLGYPFVLPDMIGGNAYGDEVPDAELMTRWAQATSAMPAMQFSIPAWDHGEACAAACAQALTWRERVFWPAMSGVAAANAAERFIPLARPVWWAARSDSEALFVGDEFLVGESLLVAPIVEQGARERRVYIPDGRWQRVSLPRADEDEGDSKVVLQGDVHVGPCWLDGVKAPLDDMPVFAAVGSM